ncbi:Protein of unknown function [Pyronema omphalodes CBS 100304]|uniref:Uncharacterized protein n=1 Tax=Pyronema omphalodes (strain CBS 100304) TaxID=1076935 RepID=U4LY04_PYROM|nr:Protein of unknown function [Pyronema omphalodes CBS 100304]
MTEAHTHHVYPRPGGRPGGPTPPTGPSWEATIPRPVRPNFPGQGLEDLGIVAVLDLVWIQGYDISIHSPDVIIPSTDCRH